jgi:hypothetical protein
MKLLLLPLLLLLSAGRFTAVMSLSSPAPTSSMYRYFAFGSNMDPSTMMSLRNIQSRTLLSTASAGVLLEYQLVFENMGGSSSLLMSRLEPSAASLRACSPGHQPVHGVIYELTDAEFAKVGRTEGVPFAYQWRQCQVIPYQGDNQKAGEEAVQRAGDDDRSSLLCYSLVSNNNQSARRRHVPPSRSYLRILQDGAAYWQMDRSYQISLAKIQVANNLFLADGLSGMLLEMAKRSNPSVRR